jgi:hypothetical protein
MDDLDKLHPFCVDATVNRSTSALGDRRVRTVARSTDVALSFAQALVDEDYDAAFALLAPEAGLELSPEVLRINLIKMHIGYAPKDRPRSAVLNEEFALTDWPSNRSGDLGRAYVSVLGDEFVEAVTVTVTSIDGCALIRDVQWGRL